ncbi:disease resistance protein RPP13-like [Lycium ferocissimum]|uniref:disease resistance protein RPP13-like n=1 Tax=Lycium ferocissimum TaxID=112874 RepID=UPI00281528CD|nr:disease resistance protein RPP13-like [Lycium ferocissimum]
MVDAFVSFAVEKLGDFLIQEVSLRLSLREDVKWLRNELLFMQSFLKDAEENLSEDQRVQQWVFEINSIANDVVAILETYSFEAGKGIDDKGFASRLKACSNCIGRKETKFYGVAKEIQCLKQRVMDISRKRKTYGIRDINNAGEWLKNGPNNQSSMVRTLRRTTSYVDEDQIFVGFQDVVERLLAEVLKAEPRRSVISIFGMGGLGKTTIARNLYYSPSLITSFRARAWICVSQEYNTLDLLRNIIKSIKGRTKEILDLLERMSESDLEIYLRDILKERKYLLVVDDVWQREAWESLRRAFPDSKNGSRIIITTRKEDVAKRADDKGFVHKLRFLSQEESWDLFCRKLLDVQAMVPTMESLARDMVDKCGGLPLAIVVLSGLLSHKRGLQEWKKVKTHLWRHMKDDSIEISSILSLSYNDLSTVLKQCFLYFGIFPEDHLIYVDNITWLWMAEGFIPRGEERTEDVAEGFLHELVRRSLIQLVSTSWKTDVRCKTHDLLRDLAMQKALEVNFFYTYDPRKHSISSSCIRHVIHGQAERYLSLDLSNLKLRSIMFLDQDFCTMSLIKFRNLFGHIYVLYLKFRSGTVLPDAIGSLYHLKFLSLRGTYNLPSSIGNLKNLQTLRILNDYRHLCRLPPETANLINLRHLVALYSRPLQLLSRLTSLQVLKYICCDQWRDVDPVDLVNLQELGMYDIMNSYSLNNIGSLKNLSSLMLRCKADESFPALEYLTSCQKLDKLWLEGRIENLPLSDYFPNSITMMVLWKSHLMEDPMPILGLLPNLRGLDLVGAYDGKEITCSNNSFCQLEFLRLDGLEKLERWHLSSSSMPLIIAFGIHDCSKLKEIPHRMEDVAILERLKGIEQEFGEYYKVTSFT